MIQFGTIGPQQPHGKQTTPPARPAIRFGWHGYDIFDEHTGTGLLSKVVPKLYAERFDIGEVQRNKRGMPLKARIHFDDDLWRYRAEGSVEALTRTLTHTRVTEVTVPRGRLFRAVTPLTPEEKNLGFLKRLLGKQPRRYVEEYVNFVLPPDGRFRHEVGWRYKPEDQLAPHELSEAIHKVGYRPDHARHFAFRHNEGAAETRRAKRMFRKLEAHMDAAAQ